MGHKIHTRIFLPVFLLLLLLPASAWIAFTVLSGGYLKSRAVRNTEQLRIKAEQLAADIYRDAPAEGTDKAAERKLARQLLAELKEQLKNGDQEASLLVIGSKYQLSYPDEDGAAESILQLYTECKQGLGTGVLREDVPTEFKTDSRRYIVEMHQIPTSANLRIKYLICFSPITEIGPLIRQTARLIALITGIYLVLAFLLIWFIAGSIAEPINKLRLQADRIGNGHYEQIPGTCSIAELEALKNSINRMSENLKQSEEKMLLFFQNVSHDLRTPLSTIGGYAQGIQCGVLKEPKKAAGIILQESGRMTELVESILMLSRLDSRAYETKPVSIQLKEFLQEQAEILSGTAGEKKILVEEDSAAVSVNADAKLLTRIVQNVISNSICYAENLVTIRVDTDSRWAVVCIADNGPGVDAGDLPHVFERFYKGKNGNFGIGLSVVQSGMQYMGGSAEMENRMPPAHGAVYRLRLPAEQEQPNPENLAPECS